MPDIQYFGRGCFRIRGKEGVVVTDPTTDGIGYDLTRLSAHVVTVSSETGFNPEPIKPMTERVFVVDGPGEYEVGGVMINGVRTYRDGEKGASRGRNTVYVIHLDDFTFCHLGALGHRLSTQQLEEIGSIDVLLVPASSALPADKVTEVISEIEPRLVIPMYDEPAHLEKLAHELALKEWTPQEKITVTAASLPPEGAEMYVMVLQPLGQV